MRIFFIMILITNWSFATTFELVDLYRSQGINSVENNLNKQLTTKKYWEYVVSKKDISYGYYESIDYLIVCQKDQKKIKLYNTKSTKELFDSSVFIGKKKGDKQSEGDLKTPIGAYSLTKKLTKIDPFYGPMALVTNYPNLYDKSLGKTGSGIWIHGVPFDQKRDHYTKGCIALQNPKIKKLEKKINIKNSVLVISEDRIEKVKKDDIVTILANIYRWRDAWRSNDIQGYLKFYDKDFKKSNGYNLAKFTQQKSRLFRKKDKKIIKFSNINIIPYPNNQGKKLYKVVMDELYKTKNYKFMGKKELYLQIKGNIISILAES